MFQKSCLFRCIQSNKNYNQNSLVEQSQMDFITTSSSSSSSSSNESGKNQWATLKRKINSSIIGTIQIRRKIVKHKKKPKALSTVPIKTRTAFVREDYMYYDFENTDDESDMSFDPQSFFRDTDNLNSSLSSVSSLEFEPFETVDERTKSYANTMITRKFEPISSSSRSNLLKSPPTQSKLSNFRPFTTSSRRSLLSPVYESKTGLEAIPCSLCCAVDAVNEETIYLQQEEKCRNNFIFEQSENICSSTLISISNQNSKIKNYEPCLINFPNLTENYSLLSSSSSSSSSSSNGTIDSANDSTDSYFFKN